jgi:hypothetical protein
MLPSKKRNCRLALSNASPKPIIYDFINFTLAEPLNTDDTDCQTPVRQCFLIDGVSITFVPFFFCSRVKLNRLSSLVSLTQAGFLPDHLHPGGIVGCRV